MVDLKVGADITILTEPEVQPQPPSAEAAGAGPAAVDTKSTASGPQPQPLMAKLYGFILRILPVLDGSDRNGSCVNRTLH